MVSEYVMTLLLPTDIAKPVAAEMNWKYHLVLTKCFLKTSSWKEIYEVVMQLF